MTNGSEFVRRNSMALRKSFSSTGSINKIVADDPKFAHEDSSSSSGSSDFDKR
jgi:hypothetical protein